MARPPLPAARFAEDLEWASIVLQAGHRLAFVPAAVVRHSHDRPVRYELQRTYLVHQRLHTLFGLSTIPTLGALARAIGELAARCTFVSPLENARAADARSVRAAGLAVAWPLGQYLGGRAARDGHERLEVDGRLMRVLLVVHGYPPDAAGGTGIYTHDLAVALAADPALRVFVLTRDADPRRPDGEVRRESRGRVSVLRINNTFASCTSFEETYRHPVVLSAAAAMLAEIDPDIAHVQHLTCLSTDLVSHLKDRGVPVVLTLHDFWMLCHRGQLVGLDGRRCDGPVGGSCARCVSSSATLGGGAYRGASLLRAIPGAAMAVSTASRVVGALVRDEGVRATASRLAHMRRVIARCDLVLSPSAIVRDRFVACGMPAERMAPWTLGIGFTPVARAERDPAAPLRLGFVGSFLPSKAPHLLVEAAARLPAGSVTVDLAGAPVDYHGDDSYRRRLTPWLAHPVVRRHGVVPHDRMPHHLSEIDVLVLPSIWLENSPLVIKEAFAAGVPVVASRLGGMAEMISDGIDGLLFAPGDTTALAGCRTGWFDEPDLVCRLQRGIIAPLTIEQDAAALSGRYRRLAEAARTVRLSPPAARPRVGAVVLNYRTPQQTWLAVGRCEPPPCRPVGRRRRQRVRRRFCGDAAGDAG